MRNISFFMTTAQVRGTAERRLRAIAEGKAGFVIEKDVTRRNGWKNLKVGELLQACVKCQGLGPGGKIERICTIRVLEVSREPLRAMLDDLEYGLIECRREGFPNMTPREFVDFFCQGHKGCTPETIVTRIVFEYAD